MGILTFDACQNANYMFSSSQKSRDWLDFTQANNEDSSLEEEADPAFSQEGPHVQELESLRRDFIKVLF